MAIPVSREWVILIGVARRIAHAVADVVLASSFGNPCRAGDLMCDIVPANG
ncbi:hypothetical protein BJ987_005924 [Nocardia goodfellowii]|uniref:Uncharacterized protein n=1 Tax=Nocardia goodfellowii TaxID=882446 RepID=A0ABS4QMT7_9NOCA|nr:hypothetical protein [Nocardia goodfellowii]